MNEMFTGPEKEKAITEEDMVNILKKIDGTNYSKEDALKIFFVWQKGEEEKCNNSIKLLELNFKISIIFLKSGLRNEAIEAFGQAADEAQNEYSEEADNIYNRYYTEFDKLLNELDEKK